MGFGEHNFRNYPMYVSFQIFGSKSCLFFAYIVVFWKFINFFENFKFSNLQQVGNFSIFGSKSSFSARVGGIKFEFCWGFYFENHTRAQAPTVSLRGSGQIYTRGPKRQVEPNDLHRMIELAQTGSVNVNHTGTKRHTYPPKAPPQSSTGIFCNSEWFTK